MPTDTTREHEQLADGRSAALLRLNQLSKRFGGVHALRGAGLTIPAPGTVHGLIGENGSGKSTLLGVLSGQLIPDGGEIWLDGRAITLSSPRQALAHGIAMVSQETAIAPDLTVTENVLMGRRLERSAWGIDWRASQEKAASILERLELDLDADRLVRDLRPDQRQMVEIARALSMQTRILILDEPTSSLDRHESDALFDVVRSLRDHSVSVVLVSHRIDELFDNCDSVTVLRDGRTAVEGPLEEFTPDAVIAAMVGRQDVRTTSTRRDSTDDTGSSATLVVEALCSARALHSVSLSVAPGEIVGLAGQVGSGRSELLECLFGTRTVSSGSVSINGQPYVATTPAAAIQAGLAFVPSDRKGQGLVLSGSIRSNLMSVAHCKKRRLGIPNTKAEDKIIAELVERMKVRMHGIEDPVSTLSGGNQQKVAIGKWLTRTPHVILLDEPTRGVDVAAKAEVHALLRDIAAQGAAIVVSSSELPELLGLCDRILVMAQGQVVASTDNVERSEQALLRYMTMAAEEPPISP